LENISNDFKKLGSQLKDVALFYGAPIIAGTLITYSFATKDSLTGVIGTGILCGDVCYSFYDFKKSKQKEEKAKRIFLKDLDALGQKYRANKVNEYLQKDSDNITPDY
jgi:uncharacterized membrane protein